MKYTKFLACLLSLALIPSLYAGKIGPKQLPNGMGSGIKFVVDGKIGPKQLPDSLWTWLLHLLGN